MSTATFVVNWVDDTAPAISVTFSDDSAGVSWSIPVDKTAPETWVDTVGAWHAANRQPPVDASQIIGQPLAIPPQS